MAHKTLVIVTVRDIHKGEPRNVNDCPVARALQRAVGCSWAWAGPMGMGLGWNRVIRTPPEVRRFIDHFDRGHPVEPFQFQIDELSAEFDDLPRGP